MSVRSYDLHQHLWPEQLLSELSRRAAPPCLRGRTLVTVEGEFELNFVEHELAARIAALDRDAIEVAVISLPATLGVETLPAEEAAPLLDAWHVGARALVAAADGRVAALAAGRRLDGFAGVSVPGRALADGGEALAPLLDELELRGGFLFVHPGPGRPEAGRPAWWAPVVDYTAEMQAAYAAWLARGAEAHPQLNVVFAILAGGGPFQLERLRSRGVEVRTSLHPSVFFDTASYGRRALELCLATYGVRQLVYGSDTPVIDPGPTLHALADFGDAVRDAVCRENPSLLLG